MPLRMWNTPDFDMLVAAVYLHKRLKLFFDSCEKEIL